MEDFKYMNWIRGNEGYKIAVNRIADWATGVGYEIRNLHTDVSGSV
jgi:hypothetical protein